MALFFMYIRRIEAEKQEWVAAGCRLYGWAEIREAGRSGWRQVAAATGQNISRVGINGGRLPPLRVVASTGRVEVNDGRLPPQQVDDISTVSCWGS